MLDVVGHEKLSFWFGLWCQRFDNSERLATEMKCTMLYLQYVTKSCLLHLKVFVRNLAPLRDSGMSGGRAATLQVSERRVRLP